MVGGVRLGACPLDTKSAWNLTLSTAQERRGFQTCDWLARPWEAGPAARGRHKGARVPQGGGACRDLGRGLDCEVDKVRRRASGKAGAEGGASRGRGSPTRDTRLELGGAPR